MPRDRNPSADLPRPTQPLDEMRPATDLMQALGVAAAAGVGTALASGALVVMLALAGA